MDLHQSSHSFGCAIIFNGKKKEKEKRELCTSVFVVGFLLIGFLKLLSCIVQEQTLYLLG